MKRSIFPLRVTLILCLLALGSFSGCQSLIVDNPAAPPEEAGATVADSIESIWRDKEAEEELRQLQIPVRIVSTWVDRILQSAGNKPVRGLGGRIYFFNKANKPIAVDGTLTVYLFDDVENSGHSSVPKKKYVYTQENFASHKTKDKDLGISYNIWVPWGDIRGEEKELAVVPVFTTSSGQVITGKQVKQRLPGSRPQMKSEFLRSEAYRQFANERALQQFGQSSLIINGHESDLNTATFNLPNSLKQQLQKNEAPPASWQVQPQGPSLEVMNRPKNQEERPTTSPQQNYLSRNFAPIGSRQQNNIHNQQQRMAPQTESFHHNETTNNRIVDHQNHYFQNDTTIQQGNFQQVAPDGRGVNNGYLPNHNWSNGRQSGIPQNGYMPNNNTTGNNNIDSSGTKTTVTYSPGWNRLVR
ncbi:MAG: hypothetical protein MPJ24_09510 [Pirellulaceae bacterium]|nr:hypothetical protein [Pirellulaceae bacterium]